MTDGRTTALVLYCPYCGLPIPEDEVTIDHIFVAALGGRATIEACATCNSTIGSDIEGRLQRSDQILNMAKARVGQGHPIRGTVVSTGDAVTYNLATSELRSLKPVKKQVDGDKVTYEVRGSPGQVRQIVNEMAKKLDLDEATIVQLLGSAQRVDLGDGTLQSTVSHDLSLADRLAAKVALGAGHAAFGYDFGSSPLAEGLRRVLNEGKEPDDHAALEALEAFDQFYGNLPPLKGAIEPITPDPGGPSTVIFLPGSRRTLIYVYLRDLPVAFSGQVINQRLPVGSGLPVLVHDASGGIRKRLLVDEIAAAMNRASGQGPSD